jgi:hypothetical protein
MRVRTIAIDPRPKGDGKFIAGADHDDWNDWLASLAASALPIDQNDEAVAIKATTALYHGMIDMKPADPIEGIIISQLMAANQSSLAMYQKAWAQPAKYFEAHTKYLALADKAARTVVLLTERLDHHRNRGQQKIVVQHTTINADQAVVATGNATDPALLTASVEKPLQLICKTIEPIGGGGGEKRMSNNPMHKAHAAPRCTAKSKRTGQPCRAPAVQGWRVCRMHGARGGAPDGERNGNYRHGARSRETIELLSSSNRYDDECPLSGVKRTS